MPNIQVNQLLVLIKPISNFHQNIIKKKTMCFERTDQW